MKNRNDFGRLDPDDAELLNSTLEALDGMRQQLDDLARVLRASFSRTSGRPRKGEQSRKDKFLRIRATLLSALWMWHKSGGDRGKANIDFLREHAKIRARDLYQCIKTMETEGHIKVRPIPKELGQQGAPLNGYDYTVLGRRWLRTYKLEHEDFAAVEPKR